MAVIKANGLLNCMSDTVSKPQETTVPFNLCWLNSILSVTLCSENHTFERIEEKARVTKKEAIRMIRSLETQIQMLVGRMIEGIVNV